MSCNAHHFSAQPGNRPGRCIWLTAGSAAAGGSSSEWCITAQKSCSSPTMYQCGWRLGCYYRLDCICTSSKHASVHLCLLHWAPQAEEVGSSMGRRQVSSSPLTSRASAAAAAAAAQPAQPVVQLRLLNFNGSAFEENTTRQLMPSLASLHLTKHLPGVFVMADMHARRIRNSNTSIVSQCCRCRCRPCCRYCSDRCRSQRPKDGTLPQ